MRSLALLLFAALASLVAAQPVEVRPMPEWVEELPVESSGMIEGARWGIYDLLTDHQARAGGEGEWHYFRIVRNVISPTGVQNASELALDFDPSFQRLVLHRVDIHRAGRTFSAYDPAEIRVIDKEESADQRIYDGQRTALVFIRDVRPGDVLDYAWSVAGSNPILGGLHADQLDLSSNVPARRVRHRLVWPAGRPLQWRGGEPVISMRGDHHVFTWERTDVAALAVEDSIPSWYEPWELVEVSEFASWHEVAMWADRMFQLDERSAVEVAALAAGLRQQHQASDAQISAAIRFVQDDIRYLGIEMGRNSHEPHQPWETLASRWGDCKDKTLLLVALLRELGVKAVPALVSTALQHRLGAKLPSPFLFDHVIVRITSGGRNWWIDPTLSSQGGELATIETPNDGLALLVDPKTRELTKIETNQRGSTHVEQTYTTASWSEPVRLDVRTTWTGADADRMRAELADLSIEDFAHQRVNALAVDQPSIEPDGLPAVDDDRRRNAIVVVEKYTIPMLWNEGKWTWYPRVLESRLERPETMIRTMPLAYHHPVNITEIVRFNFPEEIDVEKTSSVTETPALRHELAVDQNGKTLTVRQSLRSLRGWVGTEGVAEHLTKINAIWSGIGYEVTRPVVRTTSPALRWLVGFTLVALFVGISWHFATRRRPLGDAPASALLARSSSDIDSHLASLKCGCGGRFLPPAEVHRARYAERDLTIVTRQCRNCGTEQSVYFTAA